MAANVGDKFEMENLRPTMAYKSELQVCSYFLEKLNQNRAQYLLWVAM